MSITVIQSLSSEIESNAFLKSTKHISICASWTSRRRSTADARVPCYKLTRVCCDSNETSAPIANPLSSPQLEGTVYHSANLHLGPCSSVGMRRRTDRQTHRGRGQYTFRLGCLCLTRNVNGAVVPPASPRAVLAHLSSLSAPGVYFSSLASAAAGVAD